MTVVGVSKQAIKDLGDELGHELGDYVPPKLTIGQVIKAHRECEDWTLEEAAQKLGISKQALHQYETGQRLPSSEQTIRLAEALGSSPEAWLIYRIETELEKHGMFYKVRLERRPA